MKTKRTIKSPNHFKKDLGKLTREQKQKIKEILQVFMKEIRGIRDCPVRIGGLQGRHCLKISDRCKTCVFNPATDVMPGFTKTAYGLVWALYHDRLFICHKKQKNWRKSELDPELFELCSGFESVYLLHRKESILVARKSLIAIIETVGKSKPQFWESERLFEIVLNKM